MSYDCGINSAAPWSSRSHPAYGLGRVADPDRIVKLARKALPTATESLLEHDLSNDPTLQLREWADVASTRALAPVKSVQDADRRSDVKRHV
jgi:hypothetical protein